MIRFIPVVLFFWHADGLVDPVRPLSSFSSQPWHSCHKLIYVRPNPKTGVPVGHWPIPESFWPDQNSPTLVSCNIRANHNFIPHILSAHTLFTPADTFDFGLYLAECPDVLPDFAVFLTGKHHDSNNQLTSNPVSTQELCISLTNLPWLRETDFSL